MALRPPPSSARPIRVLIADDYAPMRLGVRALLEGQGFEVCADAVDAAGAIEAAVRERPDVCLLDIRMPGDGISAAETIAATLPETQIVMLTQSHDEADFLNALRAGASAYVFKDADGDRLAAVVRGVLEGDASYPRELIPRLVARLDGRECRNRVLAARGVELTRRESQILDLVLERVSTREIASRLYVAPVTVRSHVSSILRKLGVHDRVSALELLSGGDSADDLNGSV